MGSLPWLIPSPDYLLCESILASSVLGWLVWVILAAPWCSVRVDPHTWVLHVSGLPVAVIEMPGGESIFTNRICRCVVGTAADFRPSVSRSELADRRLQRLRASHLESPVQHNVSRPAFRVNVPSANVTPRPNVKCGLTPQQPRCAPPTHNERPRRGAHSATGFFSLPAFQAVRTATRTATIGVARLAAMSITQRAPCRRLRSLPRAPCRGSRGSRRIRRTPCRCFRCRTGGRRTSCSWSSP